ncbi:ABC transporter permease, partial [Streptomyces chartreusis]|uniref:ABC transporter permease n=1 Tax=Streptomyces chartreusis TaxID=1969 RepID=UPI0033C50D08
PSFGAGGSGLSPRLADAVQRLPEVDTAVGLGRGVAEVDGKGRALTVTDPVALERTFDLGEIRGSMNGLGADGIAITENEADKQHLQAGDKARLTFTDGRTQTFTVRAVYGRSELAGDYVITRAAWAPHRTQDADTLVAVSFKDGIGTDDGKSAVEKAAAPYGNPEVQTRDEYAQSAAGGIDMMLTLVYALLALAVLIALLGIANTLTLAIHERTRELGLLRAVGQTRSQLRAMVRWESILVAAFGTVGGLALGAFLGWVLVEASDGASDSAFAFAMPPLQLTVVALVGLTAGALAGLRPARRAARLDVLRAIATE